MQKDRKTNTLYDINASGQLRAAVLGINDGLVSNFSLIMGVAGVDIFGLGLVKEALDIIFTGKLTLKGEAGRVAVLSTQILRQGIPYVAGKF